MNTSFINISLILTRAQKLMIHQKEENEKYESDKYIGGKIPLMKLGRYNSRGCLQLDHHKPRRGGGHFGEKGKDGDDCHSLYE